MRKLACILGIAVLVIAAHANSFAPGNIVVSRFGDGSGALSNAATATFLDEYTPAGVFVQTIAMPTAVSGNNRRLTNSGTATSEGALTLSTDGRFLSLMGYNAALGTSNVPTTASSVNNRVVGLVDWNGLIDTTTALTDAYSGTSTVSGNPRSAVTDGSGNFWLAGTGQTNPAVRFTTLGSTSSTQLNTSAPTNTRVANIFNGQLYVSSASGAFQGVGTVGSGLPTTGGQSLALLPGFPTASGPSPYDFWFASASTLYVADDRTNGSGGLQKWVFGGSTWSLAYTLAVTANTGCRGLTGTFSGDDPVLFATTSDSKLVKVTDLGAGSPFTLLATAGTNTAFRGVDFTPAPEPASVFLLSLAGLWLRRR